MSMNWITKTVSSYTFGQHLYASLSIRLALIAYAQLHDERSAVKYTDIDYKVVTDAARHVLNGDSPYRRHTYRYSPLLAYLLVPNVLWHPAVGKLLFVGCDLLVALLIKWLVELEYLQTLRDLIRDNIRGRFAHQQGRKWAERTLHADGGLPTKLPPKYAERAVLSACAWLYNPFTMVIATRGNGDSLTCALVLGALYVLIRSVRSSGGANNGSGRRLGSFGRCALAGVLHGAAIHMRLYPMLFSVSYYVFCASAGATDLWRTLLRPPNRQQCGLVAGTVLTLAALTALFYALYGDDFLYETYGYHLVRKDTRHNFSLFFYMQYLQTGLQERTMVRSLLAVAPTLLIVGTVTAQLSHSRKTLPFAVFLHTFTFVSFNTVLTSQYFVWYMAVAPVCLANFMARWTRRSAVAYALLWLAAQALWLLMAYLLEFKGWNTFHLVWMHGAVFFGANVLVVLRLVRNFVPKTM